MNGNNFIFIYGRSIRYIFYILIGYFKKIEAYFLFIDFCFLFSFVISAMHWGGRELKMYLEIII